jgi:hypothetical protein
MPNHDQVLELSSPRRRATPAAAILKGLAIAGAVGALFAGSAAADDMKSKEASGTVKCAGLNACKGHGSCAGADNSCKAQNECKGKGWQEEKSAKACTDKGGTVVAKK